MSTELTSGLDPRAIEAVLLAGDLGKLTAEQRVVYYTRVCESLGLNPLTQPFAYIVLNGKLTLYAKRDCAEQLRKKHGVSIEDMQTELIGDVYVVRATFRDASGRTDQATGAVNIKGLSGENLSNAYMKAETKCKRRGTLSMCGLGMLDETETETIAGAKPMGETTPALPEPPPDPRRLSERVPVSVMGGELFITPADSENLPELNWSAPDVNDNINPDELPIAEVESRSLYALIRQTIRTQKECEKVPEAWLKAAKASIVEWLGQNIGVEHFHDIPTGKLTMVRRAIPDILANVEYPA